MKQTRKSDSNELSRIDAVSEFTVLCGRSSMLANRVFPYHIHFIHRLELLWSQTSSLDCDNVERQWEWGARSPP